MPIETREFLLLVRNRMPYCGGPQPSMIACIGLLRLSVKGGSFARSAAALQAAWPWHSFWVLLAQAGVPAEEAHCAERRKWA
jgi:hypothetical protein